METPSTKISKPRIDDSSSAIIIGLLAITVGALAMRQCNETGNAENDEVSSEIINKLQLENNAIKAQIQELTTRVNTQQQTPEQTPQNGTTQVILIPVPTPVLLPTPTPSVKPPAKSSLPKNTRKKDKQKTKTTSQETASNATIKPQEALENSPTSSTNQESASLTPSERAVSALSDNTATILSTQHTQEYKNTPSVNTLELSLTSTEYDTLQAFLNERYTTCTKYIDAKDTIHDSNLGQGRTTEEIVNLLKPAMEEVVLATSETKEKCNPFIQSTNVLRNDELTKITPETIQESLQNGVLKNLDPAISLKISQVLSAGFQKMFKSFAGDKSGAYATYVLKYLPTDEGSIKVMFTISFYAPQEQKNEYRLVGDPVMSAMLELPNLK